MKTSIVCILFALLHLSFSSYSGPKDGNLEPIPAESAWIRSEVGMWMGDYNVWYKVDKKNNSIKLSYNKKKWSLSNTDAAWNDKYGRWLCIYNNKLMFSENGKNWEEVKNRMWQDINGTWYRLDNNWDLWEVKL